MGGVVLILSQYSYVRYWLYNLLNVIAISIFFLWKYTVINIFVSSIVYMCKIKHTGRRSGRLCQVKSMFWTWRNSTCISLKLHLFLKNPTPGTIVAVSTWVNIAHSCDGATCLTLYDAKTKLQNSPPRRILGSCVTVSLFPLHFLPGRSPAMSHLPLLRDGRLRWF